VPATTANLGPGYDCLGLALELHNEVTLSLAEQTDVTIEGQGADTLPSDASHLVFEAARAAAASAGQDLPTLALHQVNRIPLARGLGSSSAAIVGGIVACSHLLSLGLSDREMLDVAARVEGHPDNVAPALLGGLTVCCVAGGRVVFERLSVAPGLNCVLAIPDHEVKTRDARRVLPQTVSHADAVFNLSRSSLVVAALVGGDFDLLTEAMRDRLHQPYRAPLVPGMQQAIDAALSAGACGACLSGSGPSVAAFVSTGGEEVKQAMLNAFAEAGVTAEGAILPLSAAGAQVMN
jgi:homoserine kinase